MNPESALDVQRRARGAYELGMLKVGLVRSALVTCLVGGLAALGVAEPIPAAWLAPMFVVWLLLGWRGARWWRGALGGLAVGLAGLALPMTLLRACCRPGAMAGASCSSMSQVCVAVGIVLGVGVAATLPSTRTGGETARASAGALIGVLSVIACRCESLVLGESAGLLCGLLASAAGLAAARAWWGEHVRRAS